MARPILLSLGSINADFQCRTDEALQGGKTLHASDFVRLSGGKATNRAFLARRLGHPATLIGRTGDDDLRAQALGSLDRLGVDLAHVARARGVGTAVSMITVPPDGKKTIVLANNANDAWDDAAPDDLASVVADAPAGSLLAADFEVPAAVVERMVTAARQKRLAVVIDPSFADRADRRILARADAIAPNAKEAGELAGVEVENDIGQAAEAARRLGALGIGLVCVKLADGGCVAAFEGACFVVPPERVTVVDSTGAGDAFTGALAVALLEGRPPRDAAAFATAAAHIAVQGYGSQDAYPTRERLDALAPRFLDRAHDFRN